MSREIINVLLVEDNAADAALLSLMLTETNGRCVAVETAARLADAAERLMRGGIDAVLLDLSLPDAQGIEAVVRLQPYAERIPIIVQTCLDDEELATRAMQLGAQDYVVKNKVDGGILLRTIRRAMERTRTAHELFEQRHRMRVLLENIPSRIYFKNRAGQFIQVNPAMARLYGFDDAAALIGKTDADLFSAEHATQARADEDQVFRTGKPIIDKIEKETYSDGRTTWALTTKMPLTDESGAIVGTFGISRDITELKTTELALRSSEERYGRLLDSVTDYVYTVSLENGRAVSTQHGPGCLAVTGYSPEEFRTDPWLWHRVIFPEDRDAVVNAVTQATKDGTTFEVEHRITRKDGQVRWVRNKHVPRRDATGHIVSYDGLMSDITEKKRAAEELKAAQSQLMQLEKLHSIGQLAAGVAHEVKNPLQVILVGLQYLNDASPAANEEFRSVITEMRDALLRANAVVQDLLDFSSPRELGMLPRSVNTLLEKALGFVRHDLKKSAIKVVNQLDPSLPEVLVDPTKIEQVFINLITNACHAMPDGGTLTLTTRQKRVTTSDASPHNAGDRSGMRLLTGERAIVIEVRDTGTGVPSETLSRIFEPFFTTKSTGKGTGLGLSVTRKIIDLHHGKISIGNHPEGGVIATVTLKAISQGNGKPSNANEQEKDPPH
jgi:PAS domain S-box-containing protein